jgi:hypothetical protein
MQDEELARLYPNLSPEELRVAKENLKQYLLLAWEIWEQKQMKQERERRVESESTVPPFDVSMLES